MCNFVDRSDNVMDFDDQLLGRLKRIARKFDISFMPTLVCRPIKGTGMHFLALPNLSKEDKIESRELLVSKIEAEGSSRKAGVAFSHVMNYEVELIRSLVKRGYHRTTSIPIHYLDVNWSTFSGYLKHLENVSPNSAKTIKREINKNKKEGVTYEELSSVNGYADRLYELVNKNYRKHNQIPFPFKKEFFRCLKNNLGNDAVITVARKAGNVTAVHVLLRRNQTAYNPMVGVDHEISGNDFTYFNIAYYKPIMDAIVDGSRRLYFGNLMYDVKRRRGCSLLRNHFYYKSTSQFRNAALTPWFRLHEVWWKRKVQQSVGRTPFFQDRK